MQTHFGIPREIRPKEFTAPLIDGVQYFHQPTKPLTRPNGSALVVGDRWYNTANGTEWWWNVTYWLSEQLYRAVDPTTLISGASLSVNLDRVERNKGNLFLETWNLAGRFITANNSSNYFSIELGVPPIQNTLATTNSFDWESFEIGLWYRNTIQLNTFIDIQQDLAIAHFVFAYTRVGTTGNHFPRNSLTYRYVAI